MKVLDPVDARLICPFHANLIFSTATSGFGEFVGWEIMGGSGSTRRVVVEEVDGSGVVKVGMHMQCKVFALDFDFVVLRADLFITYMINIQGQPLGQSVMNTFTLVWTIMGWSRSIGTCVCLYMFVFVWFVGARACIYVLRLIVVFL